MTRPGSADWKTRAHPELTAGGYTSRDGSVAFYTRVRAVLPEDAVVVDLGAGRGAWAEDAVGFRRRVRDLRDVARTVTGVDVDPVVAQNPMLDHAVLIDGRGGLPLRSASVDAVVSDFTFEHIDPPERLAAELARVVKPGGWVCARTPNRSGYIGVGARLVPNRFHVAALRRLQPDRAAVDVFPTRYKMNTIRDLTRLFSDRDWDSAIHVWQGDPTYSGRSRLLWTVGAFAPRLVPRRLGPMLFVFLQRRPAAADG